jgi:hypothetical protein
VQQIKTILSVLLRRYKFSLDDPSSKMPPANYTAYANLRASVVCASDTHVRMVVGPVAPVKLRYSKIVQ